MLNVLLRHAIPQDATKLTAALSALSRSMRYTHCANDGQISQTLAGTCQAILAEARSKKACRNSDVLALVCHHAWHGRGLRF